MRTSTLEMKSNMAKKASTRKPRRPVRQGISVEAFPLSLLHKRTRQQTLTQIDFVSCLSREDPNTESEEEFPVPESKRRRVRRLNREDDRNQHSVALESWRTSLGTSTSPVKDERAPQLITNASSMSRTRKFAEIPSSESPPETPLSEIDEQRSPLKEKDSNSKTSTKMNFQHDNEASWQDESSARSSVISEYESSYSTGMSAGSQSLDWERIRQQSIPHSVPSDNGESTEAISVEGEVEMTERELDPRELKVQISEKRPRMEIPDSEDETEEEGQTGQNNIKASKNLSNRNNTKDSDPIIAQSNPKTNTERVRWSESETRTSNALNGQEDAFDQDGIVLPSSTASEESQALNAQLQAALHQFSVPALHHSAETSFVTADSQSSQIEDNSEMTGSPVFVSFSQHDFSSNQTDDNTDQSSPHRRRYMGGVSETHMGKIWTDSQLLPATLMEGSLLPMPPFLSQSSTQTYDDA